MIITCVLYVYNYYLCTCSTGNLMDSALDLMNTYNSKMVAITDGSSGSIITTPDHVRYSHY